MAETAGKPNIYRHDPETREALDLIPAGLLIGVGYSFRAQVVRHQRQ